MKKTLLLALALTSVSLAGCTDKDTETTVAPVVPAEDVTPPVMTDDSTMMDNTMGADTTGAMMDNGTTEGTAPMAGDSATTAM